MQIKVVTAKYLLCADFEPMSVLFQATMTDDEIRSQLNNYILADSFGDVSIGDFAIDIHVQNVLGS